MQLYTVRREAADDFAGTVRRVADLGYDGVEFAGYGGLSASEMASLLADTELQVAGSHVGLDRLQANLDGEIAFCRAIDCPYLVLPSLPDELRTPDQLAGVTSLLDDIGRQCRTSGIGFAYHNHDVEFAQVNGRLMLEWMIEGTDGAVVDFELDVFWAAYSGSDHHAFFREYAARIPLLHLKDMSNERGWTEVGDGILELDRLYAVAADLGVRWCIVESDEPAMPPLESARRSLDNLRRF